MYVSRLNKSPILWHFHVSVSFVMLWIVFLCLWIWFSCECFWFISGINNIFFTVENWMYAAGCKRFVEAVSHFFAIQLIRMFTECSHQFLIRNLTNISLAKWRDLERLKFCIDAAKWHNGTNNHELWINIEFASIQWFILKTCSCKWHWSYERFGNIGQFMLSISSIFGIDILDWSELVNRNSYWHLTATYAIHRSMYLFFISSDAATLIKTPIVHGNQVKSFCWTKWLLSSSTLHGISLHLAHLLIN